MKIGFIGAGRVGTTIGKVLSLNGVEIAGYYSKSLKSAEESAEFTDSNCFTEITGLIKASDTLFISTPDGEIRNTWDCIVNSGVDLSGKIMAHFSGALSSDVFISDTGIYKCSIHPIYAFSDKFSTYNQFNNITLVAEGDKRALDEMERLFSFEKNKVIKMESLDKVKYHSAMVFASNLAIGLMAMSSDLLLQCGFTKEESVELIETLAKGNINNAFEKGYGAALTGPVEREDSGTVRKHTEVLEGEYLEIYKILSKRILSLAEEKYDKSYSREMKELLKQ